MSTLLPQPRPLPHSMSNPYDDILSESSDEDEVNHYNIPPSRLAVPSARPASKSSSAFVDLTNSHRKRPSEAAGFTSTGPAAKRSKMTESNEGAPGATKRSHASSYAQQYEQYAQRQRAGVGGSSGRTQQASNTIDLSDSPPLKKSAIDLTRPQVGSRQHVPPKQSAALQPSTLEKSTTNTRPPQLPHSRPANVFSGAALGTRNNEQRRAMFSAQPTSVQPPGKEQNLLTSNKPKTRSGPFQLDDSDDEEEMANSGTTTKASPVPSSTSTAASTRDTVSRQPVDSRQLHKQRVESQRMRLEAAHKKREQPVSEASFRQAAPDAMDVDSTGSVRSEPVNRSSVNALQKPLSRNNLNAMRSDQQTTKSTKPSLFSSSLSASSKDRPATKERPNSHVESRAVQNMDEKPPPSNRIVQQPVFAKALHSPADIRKSIEIPDTKAPAAYVRSKEAQADHRDKVQAVDSKPVYSPTLDPRIQDRTGQQEATLARRLEAKRQQDLVRQHTEEKRRQDFARAQQIEKEKRRRDAVRAQEVEENKRKVAAQEYEAAKARQEADARKEAAAKARQDAEAQKAAVAKAREKADAQEAAAKVRQEAEAQKEAKAKEAERKKRDEEQKQYERQQQADNARRDALRKKVAEADKERKVLEERQAALARLSAVRHHEKPSTTKGPTVSSGNKLNTNTSINKAAATYTTQPAFRGKVDDGPQATQGAQERVKNIESQKVESSNGQDKQKEVEVHTDKVDQKEKPLWESSRRDDRVKAKQARNARNREAEAAAERQEEEALKLRDQQEDDQVKTGSAATIAPKSLKSLEGQARLPQSAAAPSASHESGKDEDASSGVPAKTDLSLENSSRKRHRASHARALGEIHFEDMTLVHLRDNGVRFADLIEGYQKRFEGVKSLDTIRKRYKTLDDALKAAGVEKHLIELAAGGSRDAREKVNRAVHGQWPLPSARPTRAPVEKTTASGPSRAGGPPPSSPPFANSEDAVATNASVPWEEDLPARPQTGGKVMNDQAIRHYFQELANTAEEEDVEVDDRASREPSPTQDRDYYHFVYHVCRRHIRQYQLDDNERLEDQDEYVCASDIENIVYANQIAAKQAILVPHEWKGLCDPSDDYNVDSTKGGEGRKKWLTHWKGVGHVGVRIMRTTRHFRDGILPSSKDGWAPRTIYHVRQRIEERSGDDCFDGRTESIIEQDVDGAVYTDHEFANMEAIRAFVRLTFSPVSGHLTRRDQEIKAMESSLLDRLEQREEAEEDDPVLFSGEAEDEGERKVIKIWVHTGILKGPRNI